MNKKELLKELKEIKKVADRTYTIYEGSKNGSYGYALFSKIKELQTEIKNNE